MSGPSLAGILATRQGSLMLALVCAVCAAGVLIFALGRYKTNAVQPVPNTTVLVATGEINKGMTATQIAAEGLYKPETFTQSNVTAGAFTDASQLQGATASVDILPGTQLSPADFATIINVGQVLTPGQRGLEVSVGESPGATDITQPGSRVDIYSTAPANSSTANGAVTASAGLSQSVPGGAQLIASNVLVLKPATATPVTIGNVPVPGSTLVLALANRLVASVITDSGSLYLALRPAVNPAPTNPTTPKAAAQ